jgi:hypothetical protein
MQSLNVNQDKFTFLPSPTLCRSAYLKINSVDDILDPTYKLYYPTSKHLKQEKEPTITSAFSWLVFFLPKAKVDLSDLSIIRHSSIGHEFVHAKHAHILFNAFLANILPPRHQDTQTVINYYTNKSSIVASVIEKHTKLQEWQADIEYAVTSLKNSLNMQHSFKIKNNFCELSTITKEVTAYHPPIKERLENINQIVEMLTIEERLNKKA